MFAEVLTASLLLGALWSVLRRLAAIVPSRATACVAAQHIALGIGILGGLLLPSSQGHAALVVGVSAYLMIGAPRWRYGAPGNLGKHAAEHADSRIG